MAFLTGSNDRFRFSFPECFVPEKISNIYDPLIKRLPGYPISNTCDFLNLAIQSVSLPFGAQQTVISMKDQGRRNDSLYRGNESLYSLSKEGDITVSMRLDSSYLVYFIMSDLLYYYYATFKEKHLPDAFLISLLDDRNLELYSIKLEDVLFKSVGSISLDYSSKSIDMQKVDCTFQASQIFMSINGVDRKIPNVY